jgi:hypothetical protein
LREKVRMRGILKATSSLIPHPDTLPQGEGGTQINNCDDVNPA